MIYSLGEKKPKFNYEDVWIADSADLNWKCCAGC